MHQVYAPPHSISLAFVISILFHLLLQYVGNKLFYILSFKNPGAAYIIARVIAENSSKLNTVPHSQ